MSDTNLIQHVTVPTHIHKQTLVLVIAPSDISVLQRSELLAHRRRTTLTSHLSQGTPLFCGLLNHCASRQSAPGREHILLQIVPSLNHLSPNTLPQ